MSLESDVANLVTKAESLISYFQTRKSGIDSAVAAAIAAVPSNYKNFYVNQLTGADTADGSAAAPLKTIDKAISNTPYGGVVIVYLQTDYVWSSNINLDGRFLHLRSDTAGLRRKITSSYYQVSDGTQTYLAGIVMYNGAQMMTTDLSFVFPTPNGVNPAPAGFTNSFFKTNSAAGTVLAGVKISACDFTVGADWAGWVMASPNSAVVFEVYNSTFPAGFGGRYVNGVASGTSPATLPNLLTNLSTL